MNLEKKYMLNKNTKNSYNFISIDVVHLKEEKTSENSYTEMKWHF